MQEALVFLLLCRNYLCKIIVFKLLHQSDRLQELRVQTDIECKLLHTNYSWSKWCYSCCSLLWSFSLKANFHFCSFIKKRLVVHTFRQMSFFVSLTISSVYILSLHIVFIDKLTMRNLSQFLITKLNETLSDI